MKITDVKTTNVMVPNKFELGQSLNLLRGRASTILEIFTDEDILGLGETPADSKWLIDDIAKPILIGMDPFRIEYLKAKIWERMRVGWAGAGSLKAIGGIDTALWDIVGKSVGKPVCDLTGGRYRDEVEFFGYLHPGYKGEKGVIHDLEIPYGAPVESVSHGEGGRFTPEDIVEWAKWLVKKHGFRVIELKVGVQSPRVDIKTVQLLREELGADIPIRIDVNGAWTPETAIRTLNAMKQYDLRNAEDPTRGLSALARVRRSTGIPVSTHTATSKHVLAIANAGLDACVPDLIRSGGFFAAKKIVAMAEACELNCWLHCAGDLGITTAAMIHFLASTSYIIEPSQTGHDIRNLDDVVEHIYGSYKGPLKLKNGKAKIPDEPGLGVELNEKKLEKYAKLWQDMTKREGCKHFYDWQFGGLRPDYHRPDWFPKDRPGWIWGLDGRE